MALQMGLSGFTLISGVKWAPTSNTGFPGLNRSDRSGSQSIDMKQLPWFPEDPWDWYIYLHGWLIFMVNVGVYI